MRQKCVDAWLTNPTISNLQLHLISDRFGDPKIRSYLEDSELPAAGQPTTSDESTVQGRRLRVDTVGPSGAPRIRKGGSKRKFPLER